MPKYRRSPRTEGSDGTGFGDEARALSLLRYAA
jgi:hypothetical protein